MFNTARGPRSTARSFRKPSIFRPFPSLRVEELEDRRTPTTFTWSGAAGATNDNWSTGTNWVGNVAPTGASAQVDDLVFPAGVTNTVSNNDLTNATINSITISGTSQAGYDLTGNAITLGVPGEPQAGEINVATLSVNNILAINTSLSLSAGSVQYFNVGNSGNLTITGQLSGSTGASLTVNSSNGTGTLILAGNNSGFTGLITVNAGILEVTNSNALGTSNGVADGTVVETDATLEVSSDSSGNPVTINETLTLNPVGSAAPAELLNGVGDNTWAGPVILESGGQDVEIGALGGTTLAITGVVSSTGSGQNLNKENPGEVQLIAANTYVGVTTVDGGVLTVENDLGLGATTPATSAPSANEAVVVNSNLTQQGQLRLQAPAGGGNLIIINKQLTLNGGGEAGLTNPGAFTNTGGNNEWAAPVTLGSPSPNGSEVTIGAAAGTSLLVSGVVSSPNLSPPPSPPFPVAPAQYPTRQLIKADAGTLIFNNANTYTVGTTVEGGTLDIRDSEALGTNAVGVYSGATLQLDVEAGLAGVPTTSPQGRDLDNDSVTHNANELQVSNLLDIIGYGVGGLGALRNGTGINIWTGAISLGGTAAIGVDLDPRVGHPTSDNTYFTSDYSLTCTGGIGNGVIYTTKSTTGGVPAIGNLAKVGNGQLILPVADTYGGPTYVTSGWITIQNNLAFGPYNNAVGSTVQSPVIVSSGAAVHVKTLTATSPSLTIDKNIELAGDGPTDLNYTFINGKGALMNLEGNNTWSGEILLNGIAGIGVEATNAGTASSLTVTNTILDTTVVNAYNYNPGGPPGGFIKFGSQQLILDGDGTFTGSVDIREGSVLLQNNTGLGLSTSGTATTQDTFPNTNTTIESGAVLELGQSIADLNGGIGSGIEVDSEHLILNSPGQQIAVAGFLTPAPTGFTLTFQGQTTAVIPTGASAAQVQAALDALSTIQTDEVQTVTVVSPGTAGAFTLTYAGQTTTILPYNASAGQVQTALDALSSIGGVGGSVVVTAVAVAGGTDYTITFGGALANQSLPLITDTIVAITTGTLQVGSTSPATQDMQYVNDYLTDGAFTLTFNGSTTSPLAYNSTAAQVRTALDSLPSISGTGMSVNVTSVVLMNNGNPYGIQYAITFINGAAQSALPQITATPTPVLTSVISNGSATVTNSQVVDVYLTNPASTYTLTYTNPKTAVTTTFGPFSATATAAVLQASLATLFGMNVAVTEAGLLPVGHQYTVTFSNGIAHTTLGVLTVGTVTGNIAVGTTAITTTGLDGFATVVEVPVSGETQYNITLGGTLASLNLTLPANAITAAAPNGDVPTVTYTTTTASVDVVASTLTFTLSYENVAGTATETTTAIPITATALQVQDALNALPDLVADNGGPVTVSRIGNVFTVVYNTPTNSSGDVAEQQDLRPFTATAVPDPTTNHVAQISIAGITTVTAADSLNGTDSSEASLIGVASDNAWRGPVTVASSTLVLTEANTRIDLLGAMDDSPNQVLTGTITTGSGSQNAVEYVQVYGASGGFTLTYNGVTTPVLPYNATAAAVQDALNTLSSLGGLGGLVTVTTSSLPAGMQYTITFGGLLADTAVAQITGATVPVTVTAVLPGTVKSSTTQLLQVMQTSGTYNLTFNGQITVPIPYNATALQVQNALEGLSTINNVGTVSVTETTSIYGTVYTVTFGGGLASAAPLITVASNGSNINKRGTGELLLAGAGTFGGTFWDDAGIVTAANSQAFGLVGRTQPDGSLIGNTVVQNVAQLQLQGSLTIAGEQLTVQGTGVTTPSTLTDQWFNVGPAPTDNTSAPQSLPTSGEITGVASDPTDPKVIYIATAGGGVWKTINAGLTWTQMFDSTNDPNVALYGGSVAVAPTDPNIVYFATGDANGPANGTPIQSQPGAAEDYADAIVGANTAGTGVYMSQDGGHTWTLLTGPASYNPVYGQAITKILVDPSDALRIYVATGTSTVQNAAADAIPGVYRYDGSVTGSSPTWVNLTGSASPDRQSVAGSIAATNTPGPDDDYRIMFPQSDATWSDIYLVEEGSATNTPDYDFTGQEPLNALDGIIYVLYAALGDSQQQYAVVANGVLVQPAILNAVYRTDDPGSNNPSWWLGTGTVYPLAQDTTDSPQYISVDPVAKPTIPDGEGGGFPTGPVEAPNPYVPPGINGWIKLAGAVTNYANIFPAGYPLAGQSTLTNGVYAPQTINADITVYASVAYPENYWYFGELKAIYEVGYDGGINTEWSEVATDATFSSTAEGPTATGNPYGPANGTVGEYFTNTLEGLAMYDSALIVQDTTPGLVGNSVATTVYLAGLNNLYESTNSGTTWSIVGAGSNGIAPAVHYHDLSFEAGTGTNPELLTATDGGLWGLANSDYTDLNGDLSITQVYAVAPYPTDPSQAIAGTQNNGTQVLADGSPWTATNLPAGADAGDVQYDPVNPQIAYITVEGALYKTTDGGITWTNILNVVNPASNNYPPEHQFPLVVGPVDPDEVLVGGDGLQESLTAGSAGSFVSIGGGLPTTTIFDRQAQTKIVVPYQPTVIGAASYQGPFTADPSFPLVTDQGSNTVDQGTIYVSNGSSSIEVTKNDGTTWIARPVSVSDNIYPISFDQGVLDDKYVDEFQVTQASAGVYVTIMNDSGGGPSIGPDQQSIEVVDSNPNFTGTFSLQLTASLIDPYTQKLITNLNIPIGPLTVNGLTTGEIATAINNAVNTFTADEEQQLIAEPIFDTAPNTITLTYTNPGTGQTATTGNITITGDAAIDAGSVSAALNALVPANPTIFPNGGIFNVEVDPTNSRAMLIQFAGGIGDSLQDLLIPTVSNTTATLTEAQRGGTAVVTAGQETVGSGPQITSLTVDPSDRDIVYATADYANGEAGPTVFRSTNAGQTWTDISGQMTLVVQAPSGVTTLSETGDVVTATAPTNTFAVGDQVTIFDVPTTGYNGTFVITSVSGNTFTYVDQNTGLATDTTGGDARAVQQLVGVETWTSAIDPRDDTLYIGNDKGVWQLQNASTTTQFIWSQVGAGMPEVQVHELVLNQTLNTLTAATMGRSVFQIFLTDYSDNTGASIREVSGSSIWTGPVTMTGPTTFAADGTQAIQDGIAVASLNIIGVITDSVSGAENTVTKIGLGTVIFSGGNQYSGQTLVQQGVLEVNNPHALGSTSSGENTVVSAGASLELESDLVSEPITIFGNGIEFNGHYTGALRSVSNSNTYTGTLTLGSDATIGVDSGSTLTIGQKAGLPGVGTITDAGNDYSLDKELTGTLVLASANTYAGVTTIDQGALRVEDSTALGSTGPFSGTVVRDGAQLQIARNGFTLLPTVVTGESLTLSGTGIFGTGALENVRGDLNPTGSNDNTWAGPITFDIVPNFSPLTNPGNQVAIGVADSGVAGVVDTLTITGSIGQDVAVASFGLLKVGPGRLTLTQANTFTGVTNINGGSIRIQNPAALGPTASSYSVQTVDVVGTTPTDTYELKFNGQSTPALSSTATAATVQSDLDALSTVGRDDTQNIAVGGTGTYTLTFNGQTTASIATSGGIAAVTTALNALSTVRQSAIESIEVSGTVGRFTLSYNGNTTAIPLLAGATAAQVGTSLATLPGLAGFSTSGAVTATTVGVVTTYTLYFATAGLANQSVGQVTANPVTVLTTTVGSATKDAVQSIDTFPTAATFTLSFLGQTTNPLVYGSSAATIQAALNSLPSIGGVGGSVSVTTVIIPGGTQYLVTFGGTLSDQPIALMTTTGTGGVATDAVTLQAGLGGSVTVVGTAANYTVTFGGSLADAYQTSLIPTPTGGTATPTLVSHIPGSGVLVSSTPATDGQVFTVTFEQNTGLVPTPQLIATNVSANLAVIIATTQASGAGVVVASGADLEVDGDPTHLGGSTGMTLNKVLTVNGAGADGSANVTGTAFTNGTTSGTVYAVNFGGVLGNTLVPTLTATGTGGATATVATPTVQAIQVAGNDGTYVLAFNGASTTLPYDASAEDIQTALNSLSSISGSGFVTVTLTPNSGATSAIQLVSVPSGIAFTINGVAFAADATAAAVQAGLGTIFGVGNVTVAMTVAGGFDNYTLTFGGALAYTPVPTVTVTGGVGASVLVLQSANPPETAVGGATFLVTFGGGLANTALPITTQSVTAASSVVITSGGVDTDEVQNLLVAGTGGTYTLSLGSVTTGQIAYNAPDNPTDGANSVQAALNAALGTLGTASVTETSPGVYVVTFSGGLANTLLPNLVVNYSTSEITTPPTSTQVVTVTGISGTFTLTLNGETTPALPYNATSAQVQAALQALNGVVTTGAGALLNVSGTNTYSGAVTLGSDTTAVGIGATANTTLTVDTVQDPTPLLVPAPALSKFGQGTVVFPNANPYGGQTTVVDGVLQIQNTNALGIAQNEVQTLTTYGNTGYFALGFNGQQTIPLAMGTTTAAQVQAALDALSSVQRSVIQLVTVPVGNAFTINGVSFAANAPAATVQSSLAAPGVFGTGNVVVTLVVSGGFNFYSLAFGGSLTNTPVALVTVTGTGVTAATIQYALNGSVTVTTPSIATVVGGTEYDITFGGDLAGQNVPQVLLFPSAPSGSTGATNTGYVFTNTQTPGTALPPVSEVQTIQVMNGANPYQLTFNGYTTVNIAANATAATVQTDLNNLASIGGVGGTVVVTRTGTGPYTYTITFGALLANTDVSQITVAETSDTGSAASVGTVTAGNGAETQDIQVTGTNGSFQLTFNGQTTPPLVFNATAAQVQTALAALSSIGGVGGTVQVTLSGNPIGPGGAVYTVAFGGTLANLNLPQITASTTGGTIVNPTTANDGPDGTVVEAGGTLQLTAPLTTMSPEIVTINGQGFQNQGALNVDGANITWAANDLILGSNASIGTTLSTDTLIFTTPITDNGSGYNLDLYGPGTVEYQATGNNLYSGITTVHTGTLLLDESGGNAIVGPLVVGDGVSTTAALVREEASNQIADTAPVTVNSNGTFDLNSYTDTIGTLTVNAGTVDTDESGSGGHLTTANVMMTGGLITVASSGSLTSNNVTMTAGADLTTDAGTVGDPTLVTTQSLTLTGSSTVTIGDYGTLDDQGAVSATGSSFTFGNSDIWEAPAGVTLATSTVTATAGIDLVVTSGAVTATASTIALGYGDSWMTTAAVSFTNTVVELTANNIEFAAGGPMTLSSSEIELTGSAVGAETVSATGGISLTNASSISLGNGSTLSTPSTLSLTGASSVTLGANATLSDGSLASTDSTITLGNDDTWGSGPVSLTGSTMTIGTGLANSTIGNLVLASDTTSGASSLTVGSGGTLTTGTVTATGSQISLLGTAVADTQSISLTASTIGIGSGGAVNVEGDLTAASTAAAESAINGPGTLDFTGTNPTITVTHGTGAGPTDLLISAILQTTGLATLIKAGAGLLELNTPALMPFAGVLDVEAGDLQVDTTTGPVALEGATATLSGDGTVTTIDGGGGSPAIGTVSPGVSTATNPVGTLTSGSAANPVVDVWGAQTTFLDYVADPSGNPTPTAGMDYSQLVVNGVLDLDGATLALVVGPGTSLGQSFTIITATEGLTGTFAGTGTIVADGQEFQVSYTTTQVILTKIAISTTTTLTSSVNPSQLNQPVTFTATVTPFTGSGTFPTGDQVAFTIDGGAPILENVTAGGVATYTTSSLSVGSNTVTAVFLGDTTTFAASPPSAPLTQQVTAPTIGSVTGTATNLASFGASGYISPSLSPNVQDTYAVTATVDGVLSITPTAPTGTINVYSNAGLTTLVNSFAATGGPLTGTTYTLTGTWNGTNTGGTVVPDGTYYVTVTYQDQYGNTVTSSPITVIVHDTAPVITNVAPSNPIVYPTGQSGQTITLDATLTDTAISGYVINIYSGSTATGTPVRTLTGNATTNPSTIAPVFNGRDSSNNVLPIGQYTFTVTANDLAGNSTTSGPSTFYVFTQPTVTVATTGPIVYGQSVTLSSTVTVIPQLDSYLPGEPVEFFNGTTPLGKSDLSLVSGVYQTSLVLPGTAFQAGTYTDITAEYVGGNLPTGTSSPTTLVVTPAPLTVTAPNVTIQYGQAIPTFTYTVSGLVNGDQIGTVFTGALSSAAPVNSSVGSYPITQGSLVANSNYTIQSFVPGTLTITPAPLSIQVNSVTRDVYTANPTFTATFSGLVGNDTSAVVTGYTITTTATTGSPVGTYPITLSGTPTAKNYDITSITPGTLTITAVPTDFGVGSGPGVAPQAAIYAPNGTLVYSVPSADLAGYGTGGVRVAVADFGGDGVPDIVVGSGPGVLNQVQVINSQTGAIIFSGNPFGTFTGGVYVTTGSFNTNHLPQLVVTPDEGGGPRVIIYNNNFSPMVSYFGIQNSEFRGGARAACGDLTGDGYDDVVVAAGFEGGPVITVWSGQALANLQFTELVGEFDAFPDVLRNGTFVAVGDVNGDGHADIIVGAGPGGGPEVEVLSGATLLNQGAVAAVANPISTFFAGDSTSRSGVNVVAKSLSGGIESDVVTGPGANTGGENGGGLVTAYAGTAISGGLANSENPLLSFDPFAGLLNGVYVG